MNALPWYTPKDVTYKPSQPMYTTNNPITFTTRIVTFDTRKRYTRLPFPEPVGKGTPMPGTMAAICLFLLGV